MKQDHGAGDHAECRLEKGNGKDDIGAVKQAVQQLAAAQRFAVLATHAGGQPYTSLVAVAATLDLTGLLLATTRATRKFANLSADPRVALLIDSRSNKKIDFEEAAALTAVGQAREVAEAAREALLEVYLAKHPHLERFVRSPTCAFLKVEVEVYYLVRRFQEVMQWHLKP